MIKNYPIELVRKDKNNVRYYSLLTREYTYTKANKRFIELCNIYPHERVELNCNEWVNTDMGYAPMAIHYPI